MRRIWKYELETTDEQILKIPVLVNGSTQVRFKDQVLKIEEQQGKLCMWCLVDLGGENSDHPKFEVNRKIIIVGTGNPMPDYLTNDHYIGSYQLYGGSFVGHVFVE